MFIDPHAHTSGISPCCQMNYREILDVNKSIGLEGVVLTNHYHKPYIGDRDLGEFGREFYEEYLAAKQYGDEIGMKAFFGVEVSTRLYDNVHILVYGVGPEFVYENPEMYDYTQEQLYLAAKKHGGTVVQAHPFRNGAKMFDPQWLDGIEINCHPNYRSSYGALLVHLAEKHGLALICGGDYHADTYRPVCGTHFPDDITDSRGIGDYILNSSRFKMTVHEPNVDSLDRAREDMIYELEFERSFKE